MNEGDRKRQLKYAEDGVHFARQFKRKCLPSADECAVIPLKASANNKKMQTWFLPRARRQSILVVLTGQHTTARVSLNAFSNDIAAMQRYEKHLKEKSDKRQYLTPNEMKDCIIISVRSLTRNLLQIIESLESLY